MQERCVLRPQTRQRSDIPDEFKWDARHIFGDWDAWHAAYTELESGIAAFAARRGSLSDGARSLLEAFRAQDALGQLAFRVYYFPALQHDQDQRDNEIDARRQQVQVLMASWQQATSWFHPELLQIPLDTIRRWMDVDGNLALYRFAVETVFRQREHILDEKGEHLLALGARFESAPDEAYAALTTADVVPPVITLQDGRDVTLTYGEYRSILATNRVQADRRAAFQAFHEGYNRHRNTYAALYNGVCQRDWFRAQARGYASTLDAALFGNRIPVSVVETLIAVARDGAEPLRAYHRLRKRVLGLSAYYPCDGQVPLIEDEQSYPYEEARDWVTASVAPLGARYQDDVRTCFGNRSIDVYENDGKRSGAYSAPVYGVHPYMLLNHNDTLDAVFTLAHEMGHNLHTVLANRAQPFVYADYTIFVAEVASTLNEALLLEYLLERRTDPRERVLLLEHAIDSIASTFYAQVLFADYELRVHRMVERGEPVTADALTAVYGEVYGSFYADVYDPEPLSSVAWARIPHFFQSPYYVYQYATCFASAARIAQTLRVDDPRTRQAAVDRYLTLLAAGSSDDPMALLARAGVDLSEPDTVRAVVDQMAGLVARLDRELEALAPPVARPGA